MPGHFWVDCEGRVIPAPDEMHIHCRVAEVRVLLLTWSVHIVALVMGVSLDLRLEL